MSRTIVLSFILLISLYRCGNSDGVADAGNQQGTSVTPSIPFTVKAKYAHDTSLFTEGLVFHDGRLIESTGSPDELVNTRSMIGITDLKTGNFDKKVELDRKTYFGEGIVFFGNRLYQLTYKNKTGFIYDARTFKPLGRFQYENREGWSLTTDGTFLIMSDSTDKLTFLDPLTLKPVKVLSVTENGLPLYCVNELEFIHGFIYGNVWQTNYIVKIDPASGKVVGKIDLGVLDFQTKLIHPNVDVLNGIAYDSATDAVYVTGKLWPSIFQIDFSH